MAGSYRAEERAFISGKHAHVVDWFNANRSYTTSSGSTAFVGIHNMAQVHQIVVPHLTQVLTNRYNKNGFTWTYARRPTGRGSSVNKSENDIAWTIREMIRKRMFRMRKVLETHPGYEYSSDARKQAMEQGLEAWRDTEFEAECGTRITNYQPNTFTFDGDNKPVNPSSANLPRPAQNPHPAAAPVLNPALVPQAVPPTQTGNTTAVAATPALVPFQRNKKRLWVGMPSEALLSMSGVDTSFVYTPSEPVKPSSTTLLYQDDDLGTTPEPDKATSAKEAAEPRLWELKEAIEEATATRSRELREQTEAENRELLKSYFH